MRGKTENKYKKNVRAIITPISKTKQSKTGFVEKQSKKDYEASKSKSIEETGSLTTKDLQTVKGTNQIPLKEVGNRWPVSGENSQPADAFVYNVKILDSDAELTNAFLAEVKEQFDTFSARDKNKVEKFYEDLNTLGEADQGDKKAVFEKLRLAEEGLRKLFAFEAEPNLDKARKGYADLFNAKVSAITGLVQEAGGIKVPTQADIRQAEKNIELDFQNMFDQPGETKEDSPNDFYSDEFKDSYEMDSEDTDLQDALDDLYKNGLGFGVNPDPDVSNLDDPFTSSSDFIGRDPGVLGRLSEGLGQQASRIQEAILGKRKPPEDGFIKDRSNLYKQYVEQFAALEDFHPQVEKALGLGKNSSESERLNAYSEAYATMGRTGSLMDEVTRESINPIKDALYETKVDMTKLGNYLIGLVSPQVNRAVANNRKAAGLEELVDKDGNAAGSGLTNAQAKAMVESAMLDKGVRDFVNHKSNPIEKIFNLHKKSLEMMVNSEMISNEQYQKMLNASLDENGNFRRLPFKGMWWLDNSEFANQKAIDDLFGGSSRKLQVKVLTNLKKKG